MQMEARLRMDGVMADVFDDGLPLLIYCSDHVDDCFLVPIKKMARLGISDDITHSNHKDSRSSLIETDNNLIELQDLLKIPASDADKVPLSLSS